MVFRPLSFGGFEISETWVLGSRLTWLRLAGDSAAGLACDLVWCEARGWLACFTYTNCQVVKREQWRKWSEEAKGEIENKNCFSIFFIQELRCPFRAHMARWGSACWSLVLADRLARSEVVGLRSLGPWRIYIAVEQLSDNPSIDIVLLHGVCNLFELSNQHAGRSAWRKAWI